MPTVTPSRYNVARLALSVSIFAGICWILSYTQGVPSHEAVHTVHSEALSRQCDSISTKRIAIIGAGSGGASTAYYLDRFKSPCNRLNITVYERSSYVGGRSTTVNVYDDPMEPVELGASIFVEANRNLVSAAREFGLSTSSSGDNRPHESPEMLGVWDGSSFRFTQSEGGYMWWSIAKLIWKYGLAPIRTQRLMKGVVGNFFKMYDEPHFPFRSLSQVVYDLGLTTVTSATGAAFLEKNKIVAPFSTDIVQASTRVNYAQNIGELHGLETMVCMATDGAMAVSGGNWQIFDGMLRAARANVALNTSVSEIAKQEDGTYLVRSKPNDSLLEFEEAHTGQYDTVVIAAPFQFSDIKLTPTLEHIPDRIPYVKLQVTLFASPHRLSPLAFNLPASATIPEIILTTLPNGSTLSGDERAPAGFFSISTLRTVSNHAYHTPRVEYLYKIFSPHSLNATLLSTLLGFSAPGSDALDTIPKEDISWLYEKSWYSYPYLPPRVTFEEPQLDIDLWYTSGIESFISTMETSSLMGMNVARLIVDDWALEGGESLGVQKTS